MSEVSTEFEEGVLNHDNTRDIDWFLPTASRYGLMHRKPIFNRKRYQTNPLRKNQDSKQLQALSSQVRGKFELTTHGKMIRKAKAEKAVQECVANL